MQHCDPDVLSLAALGEQLSAADAAHLAECSQCREDVEQLAVVVSAVRVTVPAGPPVAPPPAVWDRIAAQTGVSSAPRGQRLPAEIIPLPAPRSDRARRWSRGSLMAVAASALVVGAAGGSLITHAVTKPGTGPIETEVRLAALPLDPGANGEARIVRTGSGTRDLVVDVSRLEDRPGTFYEVWLIDTTVKKMVPVGILHGSEGRFTIPASVDVGQFPVVDISVQQPGDPRHSGKSVLRGTLPA